MHATALVDALKREMRSRAITYAGLASRIGMSEASVKRMFSQKNFTLQRLDVILRATGIELRDIALGAGEEPRMVSALSFEQEEEIISDPQLLVAAVSALNQLSAEQIVSQYTMTMAEVIGCLARLDRIGFLELLPNNRIKLLVSRTFQWLPNGPIQRYFRQLAVKDYLNSSFDGEREHLRLVNVMLSKESIAVLIGRMKQMAREFSQQHQEDARLPFEQRHALSVMLAARPWIPDSFKVLQRG